MRFQIARHLGGWFPTKKKAVPSGVFSAAASAHFTPPEFNHLDYVSYLLHIGAEIEHALMVEYLYGAYSLGGPQVPEQHRQAVARWQEIILGISKEEMAHLISAQNALRLIGAPLNLSREDYPWDTPFYPFPFKLEPLTLDSLAKYIYAESPENWSGPEAEEIKKRVAEQAEHPHRVGELFALLLDLIGDEEYLPDTVFQSDTFPFQASWDEWGRGYQGGARGTAKALSPTATPNLLVVPMATRDDLYNGLSLISQQGEACFGDGDNELSHFRRFLTVYREMKASGVYDSQNPRPGAWHASRPVAVNPYIAAPDEEPGCCCTDGCGDNARDPIRNPEARNWANLFNVRYRLMLQYLLHSFELADGYTGVGAHNPRGLIINSTFGEMYNMRAIANFLVETPLALHGPDAAKMAGPPFLMPYTLNLPLGEANRWRQHQDLLQASECLIQQLRHSSPPARHGYLNALAEADQGLSAIIDRIICGCAGQARL